jgi:transposase
MDFPDLNRDGVVFVEYLKRTYKIDVHVCHAQRLMRKLGYTLGRPMYRLVQAKPEGVKEFQKTF